MVERKQQQVLVLEDDIRFELNFKRRLNTIMEDIWQTELQWDLMYVEFDVTKCICLSFGFNTGSCLALGKHMASQLRNNKATGS